MASLLTAYLPDVEVKADLIGSSSGLSLSIAHRLDKSCSWDKCSHSGRRIYVSGYCGNAVPSSKIINLILANCLNVKGGLEYRTTLSVVYYN